MKKGMIFSLMIAFTFMIFSVTNAHPRDSMNAKRPVKTYTLTDGHIFTVGTTNTGDVIMTKENGEQFILMNYTTVSPGSDLLVSTEYDKAANVVIVKTCPTQEPGVVNFSTISCVNYNFNVQDGRLINKENSIPKERKN